MAIDGDPEALRRASRSYGRAGTTLSSAQLQTNGLNLQLAEPYAFAGPAGDRFKSAVADATRRLGMATMAFEEVSAALQDLSGPIEDFNDAKKDLARARRRFEAAKAAYEAKQADVLQAQLLDPFAAVRALPAGMPGSKVAGPPAPEVSAASERQAYEEAEQALTKAQHRFDVAETRKKSAVRTFVNACDDASALAPPLPEAPSSGPYGNSKVGRFLNGWAKIGEGTVNTVTHPWKVPGSVVNGLGDAGKGIVGGVGFLGELGVENARLTQLLGIDGVHDKTQQLEAAAKFAKDHPGQFAAAVANLETLQKDPVRWLVNLAPETVMAVATGGTSAVATRSARAADDAKDAARVARTAKAEASGRLGTARAKGANVEAAAAKRRGELDASGTPYAVDAQLATLNQSLVTARTQISSAVEASRAAKRAEDAAAARAATAQSRAGKAATVKQRTTTFDDRIFSPAFGIADPLRPNPVDPPQVAAGKDALNKLFGGTVGAVANPELEGDPPRK